MATTAALDRARNRVTSRSVGQRRWWCHSAPLSAAARPSVGCQPAAGRPAAAGTTTLSLHGTGRAASVGDSRRNTAAGHPAVGATPPAPGRFLNTGRRAAAGAEVTGGIGTRGRTAGDTPALWPDRPPVLFSPTDLCNCT